MTREQAQVYAKMSREDIAKIDNGYAKHYDVLRAFANGEEIQLQINGERWADIDEAYFCYSCEYRVKERESGANTDEPWKPKDGRTYFFICADGDIKYADFRENDNVDPFHLGRIELGNCFRTRAEAEEARERVKVALKGDNYIYIVKNDFVDYFDRESYSNFREFADKKSAINFFEKLIPDNLKEMELIQKDRNLELETFKYGKNKLTWGCELRDKDDAVEAAYYTYLIRVPIYHPVKSETEEEL